MYLFSHYSTKDISIFSLGDNKRKVILNVTAEVNVNMTKRGKTNFFLLPYSFLDGRCLFHLSVLWSALLTEIVLEYFKLSLNTNVKNAFLF